jgi:hypothetical protein
MRPLFPGTALLIGAAMLLPACGGDDSKSSAAPGSPENPLVAQQGPAALGERSNEAAAAAPGAPAGAKETQPGYEGLLKSQSGRPRTRFTPCNLVSEDEAQAIFGSATAAPLEARQGPTCIYRTRSGKGFVTLAVQSVRFEQIRPLLRQPRQVAVSDRVAYCGQHGQPMLYMPLSGSRVLSVAGPCPVAARFAAKAAERL